MAEMGDTLRQRRLELGWSMRTLEAASGVDDAVISRIENGSIAQPRLDKITKIAAALGLDPMNVISTATNGPATQAPLAVYLTARFPGLPLEAVDRIERYIERVLRANHINPQRKEER